MVTVPGFFPPSNQSTLPIRASPPVDPWSGGHIGEEEAVVIGRCLESFRNQFKNEHANSFNLDSVARETRGGNYGYGEIGSPARDSVKQLNNFRIVECCGAGPDYPRQALLTWNAWEYPMFHAAITLFQDLKDVSYKAKEEFSFKEGKKFKFGKAKYHWKVVGAEQVQPHPPNSCETCEQKKEYNRL